MSVVKVFHTRIINKADLLTMIAIEIDIVIIIQIKRAQSKSHGTWSDSPNVTIVKPNRSKIDVSKTKIIKIINKNIF